VSEDQRDAVSSLPDPSQLLKRIRKEMCSSLVKKKKDNYYYYLKNKYTQTLERLEMDNPTHFWSDAMFFE
jgi:hypothetical protein